MGYSCEESWFNLFVDIQAQQDAPTKNKDQFIYFCQSPSIPHAFIHVSLAMIHSPDFLVYFIASVDVISHFPFCFNSDSVEISSSCGNGGVLGFCIVYRRRDAAYDINV
jgi:hypothetical protein